MHLHHITLDYIKVQWNSMIFSHVTVHVQYVKWASVVQNHHKNVCEWSVLLKNS